MKKVLALALVLVLALGMMVPAHAKIEVESHDLQGIDYSDVGDIGPDWAELYTINFTHFNLSDDAIDALDDATVNNYQSVMNRIAKTIDVKVRARKGGALMSVSVEDPVFSLPAGFATTVFNGLQPIVGGNPAQPSASDVATRAAWIRYIAQANVGPITSTHAAYNSALAVYDNALLAAVRNRANWNFIIELESPDIPWPEIKEIDFEVDILLHVSGRSDNNWYWTVTGTIANEIVEVDADHEYANGYDGHVIEATEYVPKIAICGNYDDDVIAHVKMAKDKKIFFVAVVESDMADEAVFDRYPSIEWAYKILQVGLNSYTGNFIELGAVDSSYYVYGKNSDGGLKYLGRGGELLPLSGKYYISTQKLDLSSDEPVDEIPVDVPSIVDDYNPSTGI